jgi:hypothetical protein
LGFTLPSTAYLIGVVIFGIAGFVAYWYGKKKSLPAPKWIGIALMLYPYAISTTWLLYVVGAGLCVGAYLSARRVISPERPRSRSGLFVGPHRHQMQPTPPVVTTEQLTQWAESLLHINHLNTLVQREIAAKSLSSAADLSERARKRVWTLLNEMFAVGAAKPEGYSEPGTASKDIGDDA